MLSFVRFPVAHSFANDARLRDFPLNVAWGHGAVAYRCWWIGATLPAMLQRLCLCSPNLMHMSNANWYPPFIVVQHRTHGCVCPDPCACVQTLHRYVHNCIHIQIIQYNNLYCIGGQTSHLVQHQIDCLDRHMSTHRCADSSPSY